MSENLDFLGKEEKKGPGDLSKLKAMIGSMQALDKEIKDLESNLEIKKKMYEKYNSEDIPMFLNEHGLSEIRLDTGEKVTIKSDVYPTVNDYPSFISFLRSRQEDDICKFTATFARMETPNKAKLIKFLAENEYNYKGDDKVNPQTLKKYVRELMGIGQDEAEIKQGIETGKFVSRETIDPFMSFYTKFKTKIK